MKQTRFAVIVAAVVLPLMIMMFGIALLQTRDAHQKSEVVRAVPVIKVVHSDQRFFGARVSIWDGTQEYETEFPMGTARLSDENPSQEIQIGRPPAADEWCIISLDMNYGEQAGRHYSFTMEKGQLKSLLSLEMDENDKPVLRARENTWFSDLQPEVIEFYAFNELFAGARISIKNEEGKVLWVNIPEPPKSHDRFLERQEWGVVKKVPTDFDLTRTYTMRIHFKNGMVSKYSFYRIGAKHISSHPNFYLHVCSNYPTEKGNFGLRPKVLLNGAGSDVWPAGSRL